MGKEISAEYIAGFFDADGSVGLYLSRTCRKYKTYTVWVNICQLDPCVLRFLTERYSGTLRISKGRGNRRDIWSWKINSKRALVFLRDIYPHLIGKKEQVRLVMEFVDLRAKLGLGYANRGRKMDLGSEYDKKIRVLKHESPKTQLPVLQ